MLAKAHRMRLNQHRYSGSRKGAQVLTNTAWTVLGSVVGRAGWTGGIGL